MENCPGADNVKIPELELKECPKCGGEVEFFTRDKKSTCSDCGEIVFREARPSCIDWCPMAEKCFPGLADLNADDDEAESA